MQIVFPNLTTALYYPKKQAVFLTSCHTSRQSHTAPPVLRDPCEHPPPHLHPRTTLTKPSCPNHVDPCPDNTVQEMKAIVPLRSNFEKWGQNSLLKHYLLQLKNIPKEIRSQTKAKLNHKRQQQIKSGKRLHSEKYKVHFCYLWL